jgi:hypothetical protein
MAREMVLPGTYQVNIPDGKLPSDGRQQSKQTYSRKLLWVDRNCITFPQVIGSWETERNKTKGKR